MHSIFSSIVLVCCTQLLLGQNVSKAPDAVVMRLANGSLRAGIVHRFDPQMHTYEILLSPGSTRYLIKDSGYIKRVSDGAGADEGVANTQLSRWRYLQHNTRLLRISRGTNVVLCFLSSDDAYIGQIRSYHPTRGYRVLFYGPGNYYVEITPDLRVRRTNVPNLQGQTLFRMNIMTEVGADNTFPY